MIVSPPGQGASRKRRVGPGSDATRTPRWNRTRRPGPRDASLGDGPDGSAAAVNAAQARETAPEPGNRSSRLSPRAAPSSPNTHRQNAVGLAPVTRPGRVVTGVTPHTSESARGPSSVAGSTGRAGE